MTIGYFNDGCNNLRAAQSIECVYFMSVSSIVFIIVFDLRVRRNGLVLHHHIRSREYGYIEVQLEIAF